MGGFDQNTPAQPGHVFQVTCTAPIAPPSRGANKSGNLPNIPANAIMDNPRFRQQVFVGTDWGVYYTNNIDAPSPVWERFNNGMANVMIWDIAIDRGFTTLAAFTRSRGDVRVAAALRAVRGADTHGHAHHPQPHQDAGSD